jgi:hypothetical protein
MKTKRHLASTSSLRLGIVVLGLSALAGCAHHPPSYSGPEIQTQFFEGYAGAWEELRQEHWPEQAGSIAQLEMVHPTISDGRSVRIWYLLKPNQVTETAKPEVQWRPQGSSDWLTIPPETFVVLNVGGAAHGARVVEVPAPAFGAATVFQLRLSGGGLTRTHPVDVTLPPAPDSKQSFSFLVSSCFLPWKTDGQRLFVDESTRSVLESLGRRSRAPLPQRPAFHLQLGDQIYTDGGAGQTGKDAAAYLRGKHSDSVQGDEGGVASAFDALYRYNFGIHQLQSAMAHVPSAMMIDDHEIRDGWGARGDSENQWSSFYAKGRHAFRAFQASRNPGGARQDGKGFHYQFGWSGARFFALDTRTRADCTAMREKVCGRQDEDLDRWLRGVREERQNRPTLLVVSLGVPLTLGSGITTRMGTVFGGSGRDDALDRLSPGERVRILGHLAGHLTAAPRHRLLVLSGDVHYSGMVLMRLEGKIRGYEVISSGLAQQSYNLLSAWGVAKIMDGGGFKMESRGVNAVPSFAEIFVDFPSEHLEPSVKVLFFPGASVADWTLAGRGSPELSPVRLDLEEGHLSGGTPVSRLAKAPEYFLLPRTVPFRRSPKSCLARDIALTWGFKPGKNDGCTP